MLAHVGRGGRRTHVGLSAVHESDVQLLDVKGFALP